MRKPPILLMLLCLAPVGVVQAEPANARLYKSHYGYAPGCNACHVDGGGSPLNPYGKAFAAAGANAGAFAAIADADADGDGQGNAAEAQAKANPGDPQSTPGKAGNWLDLSQLIPKEVQAAFPGVKLYKPIDALLTDKEIQRAAAWGVTLSAADENTIYVAVADKRPVGTALIVPGLWQGEKFFLLVSTDRQFKVSQVLPVSGKMLPAAGGAEYSAFAGAAAKEFPKTAEGLPAALSEAVHRGLALVTVRLTKS